MERPVHRLSLRPLKQALRGDLGGLVIAGQATTNGNHAVMEGMVLIRPSAL